MEAQIESIDGGKPAEKPTITDAEKTARRERDSLRLSRAYVQHQIECSTNERYTASLRQALSEIDKKLEQLGPARR